MLSEVLWSLPLWEDHAMLWDSEFRKKMFWLQLSKNFPEMLDSAEGKLSAYLFGPMLKWKF